MPRRKTRKLAASTEAPNDGTRWGDLSDADLLREAARELARRRAARGELDLNAMESFSEEMQRDMGQETLGATLAALPPESATAKPCPKCSELVPVKARNRVRHVMTVAGELRVSRNYHYCERCEQGFYPRDRELKLPEEGEVSDAMERRILDFGVNTGFEEAAQRWAIHYPVPISENLVRRVVDRVGERAESAYSEETLQRACIPTPPEPPKALVIAGDGSMLKTREENWKETKVAVVAAGESIIPNKNRNQVEQARYVAVLGGNDEFKKSLDAALKATRADEVTKVAWLGDGAPENFTMATELCPLAVQILDIMHAVQNGTDCGKVLLGEDDQSVPLWQDRITALIDAPSPDAAIRELMDCVPLTEDEEQLAALNKLVGYYRRNEKRMRYTKFREMGLPIGSGIVESAHGHVLQVRMKRSGQSWSIKRARRMARLRALYKTAGPRRFHWAIREALKAPVTREGHTPLPNGPRRRKQSRTPSRVSPLGRKAASI
jgi:hypothetical protein